MARPLTILFPSIIAARPERQRRPNETLCHHHQQKPDFRFRRRYLNRLRHRHDLSLHLLLLLTQPYSGHEGPCDRRQRAAGAGARVGGRTRPSRGHDGDRCAASACATAGGGTRRGECKCRRYACAGACAAAVPAASVRTWAGTGSKVVEGTRACLGRCTRCAEPIELGDGAEGDCASEGNRQMRLHHTLYLV